MFRARSPVVALPLALILGGCACGDEIIDVTTADAWAWREANEVEEVEAIPCDQACAAVQGGEASAVTSCSLSWAAGADQAVDLYDQSNEDPPEGMADDIVGTLTCGSDDCG